ncbi:MAG TPA: hypothetical protein ENG69_02955 [Candidatus Korarchaeota archaeon]|nr:hypothetical protein [Candidatus Korarchaeota archaeon]
MARSLSFALLLLISVQYATCIMVEDSATLVVRVEGTITKGVAEYITGAIDYAREAGAAGVVIVLNTDGGFLDATEEIILAMRESPVPIAVYVPPGGRAFSAGSLILLASDVAGMGPGSAIGAAEPRPYDPKVSSAVASWARSLAKSSGRNVTAAESFVLENLALSADEALAFQVVEHVADTLEEFIEAIGWPLPALEVKPSSRTALIILITEPLNAWALVIIGGLLLLAGLSHPTYIMEGVGAGLLVLGLFGLNLMGVGLAAAGLILAGVTTMFFELKTGHGVLAISGTVMAAIGLMLVYRASPLLSPGVGVEATVAAAILGSGIVGFYLYKIRQTLKLKPTWGDLSQLVGKTGVVRKAIRPGSEGVVLVGSELWTAVSEEELEEGERVKVVGVEGFRLIVRGEK